MTATLTVKIPDDTAQRLQTIAQRTRRNKSRLVRDAIHQYLDDQPIPTGSALELAGDLVGQGQGPDDLASNPVHLQHFGENHT